MTAQTDLAAAPYAHHGRSIPRIMMLVVVALLPATVYGLYQFGWPAINLFVITIASAILCEIACLALARRPIIPFLTDGSALLTGWLLAMTLPPWAPWWIGVLGGITAIGLGKQIFGGVGQNPFNPAMVARVALLISFPLEMTFFVGPHPFGTAQAPLFMEGLAITFGNGLDMDAVSAASALGHVKTELGRGLALNEIVFGTVNWWSLGLGPVPGSLGETSALLIFLGGLLLLAKGVISWHIPLAMLATVGGMAGLFHLIDPTQYAGPAFHLLAGGTMLGAFFIATDMVTSPVTHRGQLIFGAGCGLLVFVIRTWAGYPEGVAFAVLVMNAATPLIDRWVRPRIFGTTRRGKPLEMGGRR
ncbi:RnfABCDGE type electron transport complex subunit D [Magnetospira sp. QH-2]|uniref:RnfABCDGE type electron transport complex subunit D n=1 Tax=Magnetospira sp. (strain QH-2) TaxID=1288970 RepID=UPI0003E80BD4|nr:RnfABCDGE type electron transport complex subunit D [Magnetospira sp. QH-2]CCQ72923.1 Electron transport complex protein rnfD [Magnetospira sp. QH-2]